MSENRGGDFFLTHTVCYQIEIYFKHSCCCECIRYNVGASLLLWQLGSDLSPRSIGVIHLWFVVAVVLRVVPTCCTSCRLLFWCSTVCRVSTRTVWLVLCFILSNVMVVVVVVIFTDIYIYYTLLYLLMSIVLVSVMFCNGWAPV